MRKPVVNSSGLIESLGFKIGSAKLQKQSMKEEIFYRVTQMGYLQSNPTESGIFEKVDFTEGNILERRNSASEYYNALDDNATEARRLLIEKHKLSEDFVYALTLSFVEGEPLHEGIELYLAGYHDKDEEHTGARAIEDAILKHFGIDLEALKRSRMLF